MKLHPVMVAGAAICTLLVAGSPLASAAELQPAGDVSAVRQLLQLLEAKGVINANEAGELARHFGREQAEPSPNANSAVLKARLPNGPFTYDEVSAALAELNAEGVLSAGERDALVKRAMRLDVAEKPGAAPAPAWEPQGIGLGEVAILTGTREAGQINGDLTFLAQQNVLTRDEAAAAFERYNRRITAGLGAKDTPVVVEKTLPNVPFAHEEVASTIESLAEQGVVDAAEGQELRRRTGDMQQLAEGATVAERQPQVVGLLAIPYQRTTLTPDDVRDQLKFLAHQRVLTPDEAAAVYGRFDRKYPTDQFAENISMEVKSTIANQMEQKTSTISSLEKKMGKLPEWLNRFKLYGDIRLRYQGDYFDKNNTDDDGFSTPEITTDRQRFRIRTRLGLLAKVSDDVEAALGLTSGSTSDPVSTNQTLGDGFNKKTITLDTAYLKWTPYKEVTAWGGRIPNPWFSTDLVWDKDLNFDGVAVSYAPALSDTLSLFLTAGVFPLQEVKLSAHDKWLYGGQAGLSWQPVETVGAKLGVAYYRFENTQGKASVNYSNEFDYTVPAFAQKGNTVFDINAAFSGNTKLAQAAKFHELAVTGSLDLSFWNPIHLVLMGDFVMNLGYDTGEVNSLTGLSYGKENIGYQLGLAIGHGQFTGFGDWRGYLNYRYLEADAVMDSYTDSDFHLGGTNAKGWTIGAELGLRKNIWLSGKWMTASEISGAAKLDIDVFQLDLNAKF
jgi:hypothetical protein